MTRTRTALLGGAAALITAAAASTAGAASTKVVAIKDIDFKPSTVRITRGSTVEWRFLDAASGAPHNVRSRGRLRFRGSATKTTGTHRVRFRRTGTYRYVCTVHPGMDGKVVVR